MPMWALGGVEMALGGGFKAGKTQAEPSQNGPEQQPAAKAFQQGRLEDGDHSENEARQAENAEGKPEADRAQALAADGAANAAIHAPGDETADDDSLGIVYGHSGGS